MIFSPPTLKDGPRWSGMRVGLLGGSFNPAHEGHLHIARIAMKKFGLDCVWWLVTPQNPLKHVNGMAPYEKRFASVQQIIGSDPGMVATHLERNLGTRYTYDTVSALKTAYPKTEFLFICGMDNAVIFHKWDRWEDLAYTVPIVFIARPPAQELVRNCPIRMLKVPQHDRPCGRRTSLKEPHIYWLSAARMIDQSSTKIRSKINWLD